MGDKLEKVKQILSTYNQEHLLKFYKELDMYHKELLLNQILNINFEQIINLYQNSMKNEDIIPGELSPLKHFEKNRYSQKEISYYTKIGENFIKNNGLAVVTLAGGQGTRLGYRGPKGTYVIKFDNNFGSKSFFEIICEDLKRANTTYNVTLPWYIMTSEENDLPTKTFFDIHNYWDYPKEKIKFFKQGKLPLITVDGKLFLQEPYLVKEASNGNGNVFASMKKHGIIEELIAHNISLVYFGGIDNILQKNVDPFFIGLAIDGNYQVASKSIFKELAMEKTAVYCRKFGKPSILDYDEITLELSNRKDENGLYLYREANILSHLMTTDAIQKVSNISLKYHRAYKKNAFVNDEGVKQIPDSPNSFKFENFIFDAFSYFDDMLLLRVNTDEEFAPVKSFNGVYNLDKAKEKYEKQWSFRNNS